MLRDHFDSSLLLEVFEENPFLSKFYESRAQYAFQTQMFFLLSRYRQQQQVPRLIQKDTLISDYMFAKDRLFAQLNLAGDEWEIYQQLHGALAEQIPTPDLLVYLQADTDVLMGRIALRDRTYERHMDREYIDDLRQAYDRFFSAYDQSYVLTVDTNELNFVTNSGDFQTIVGQVRSVLQEGIVQKRLPQFDAYERREGQRERRRSLPEYQQIQVELDRAEGYISDLYFNYLRLTEEMGALGSELARLWQEETKLMVKGQKEESARAVALRQQRKSLETELADCMAYLLKLANYAGVDLETAYQARLNANQRQIGPG